MPTRPSLLTTIQAARRRAALAVVFAAGSLVRTQFGLAQPQTTIGTTAPTQQRENRRRLLNDALILLCAGEHGAILVSGNVADLDILLRFRPDIPVLPYRA
jgi:hypothetical protein